LNFSNVTSDKGVQHIELAQIQIRNSNQVDTRHLTDLSRTETIFEESHEIILDDSTSNLIQKRVGSREPDSPMLTHPQKEGKKKERLGFLRDERGSSFESEVDTLSPLPQHNSFEFQKEGQTGVESFPGQNSTPLGQGSMESQLLQPRRSPQMQHRLQKEGQEDLLHNHGVEGGSGGMYVI